MAEKQAENPISAPVSTIDRKRGGLPGKFPGSRLCGFSK